MKVYTPGGEKLKLYLIVGITGNEADDHFTVHQTWTEYERDGWEEGFEDNLERVRKNPDYDDVRVVEVEVDGRKLREILYGVQTIDGFLSGDGA